MCGQSGPLCHPLQPHTFTQLTFTAQVYIRPCPHTPTPVRPPRLEGNHEKATLCSQTAQCDRSGAPLTPMQQPLPTERSVCVHFYAFVSWPSCILKCTERCSLFSLQSVSHSVWFQWVTPARNQDVSHEQSADVLACPLSIGAPLVVLLRWWEQDERPDWLKCWHLSCVFVAVMVWSGQVTWSPELCSIPLCRPWSSRDENCQGQISHICWIMVTIECVQHSWMELFFSMCVYAIVTEQMCECYFFFLCNFFLLITYVCMHVVCGFFLFSSVNILACQLSSICMLVLISVLTLSSMSSNQDPTVSSTDVNFLMREEVVWGNCSDKFGKRHESFSVMHYQRSLPLCHACHDSSAADGWFFLLSASASVIF